MTIKVIIDIRHTKSYISNQIKNIDRYINEQTITNNKKTKEKEIN